MMASGDKEDEDEEQVDLLYRCGCKWKGAEPCSAAFDNEEAMWQHLINIQMLLVLLLFQSCLELDPHLPRHLVGIYS